MPTLCGYPDPRLRLDDKRCGDDRKRCGDDKRVCGKGISSFIRHYPACPGNPESRPLDCFVVALLSMTYILGCMRTDTPKEIFLKDYTPPAYKIGHVDLDFNLNEGRTVVTSVLEVHKNAPPIPPRKRGG